MYLQKDNSMKILRLFLLFTFGLWADFKLDISNDVNVSNNKEFYKEVATVFVQPLYRPINTAKFEEMNASEMSLEMKESIEEFLPIYLSTQSPLCKRNKDYPTTEIQRFFKVLNKYIGVLQFENKDKEIYEIFNKRLSDASDCIKDASSLLDLLFGMVYYDGILDEKKYINSQIIMLLQKYNLPKKEYFFDILEKERKQGVDIVLKAMSEDSVSHKDSQEFTIQLNKYTQFYYAKYGAKLRDTVQDDSYEAVDEYEDYIDTEFQSIQKVSTMVKMISSRFLLKIQNTFSMEKKSYENISDHHSKTVTLLMFMSLADTYSRYLQFLQDYNKLLNSSQLSQ